MKLTKENIEEYLLLLVDDELDAASVAAVETFLAQHQEYRPMLEAYRATKSDPDEHCIFPGKESLLRPEPATAPLKKGNPFRLWRQAAAVALLLGIGLTMTWMAAQNDKEEGAETQQPVALTVPRPSANSKPQERAVQAAPAAQPSLAATTTHNTRSKPGQPVATLAQQPVQPPVVAQHRIQETITPLATVTSPAMLPPESHVPAGNTIAREPVATLAMEHKILPGWLPVKEESLEGVNDLVGQVQALRDNLSDKAKMLKKASFVIRIGNKDVIALGR